MSTEESTVNSSTQESTQESTQQSTPESTQESTAALSTIETTVVSTDVSSVNSTLESRLAIDTHYDADSIITEESFEDDEYLDDIGVGVGGDDIVNGGADRGVDTESVDDEEESPQTAGSNLYSGQTIFEWDGSHLGRVDISMIPRYVHTNIGMVIFINFPDGRHGMGRIRRINNCVPAMLDEFKPWFGLIKMGTHTFIYEKALYLWCRVESITPDVDVMSSDDVILIPEITLPKILNAMDHVPLEMVDEIGKILIFRIGLGAAYRFENDVMLRTDRHGQVYAVLGIDRIRPGTEVKLTQRMDNIWLAHPYGLVVDMFAKQFPGYSLPDIEAKIVFELEEIADRISPEHCYLVRGMVDTIFHFLELQLAKTEPIH